MSVILCHNEIIKYFRSKKLFEMRLGGKWIVLPKLMIEQNVFMQIDRVEPG